MCVGAKCRLTFRPLNPSCLFGTVVGVHRKVLSGTIFFLLEAPQRLVTGINLRNGFVRFAIRFLNLIRNWFLHNFSLDLDSFQFWINLKRHDWIKKKQRQRQKQKTTKQIGAWDSKWSKYIISVLRYSKTKFLKSSFSVRFWVNI